MTPLLGPRPSPQWSIPEMTEITRMPLIGWSRWSDILCLVCHIIGSCRQRNPVLALWSYTQGPIFYYLLIHWGSTEYVPNNLTNPHKELSFPSKQQVSLSLLNITHLNLIILPFHNWPLLYSICHLQCGSSQVHPMALALKWAFMFCVQATRLSALSAVRPKPPLQLVRLSRLEAQWLSWIWQSRRPALQARYTLLVALTIWSMLLATPS